MWGVPLDHKCFDDMNITQWLWYYYQDMKDQEEAYLKNRNLVEYLASFIEPELVSKVVKEREQNNQSNESVKSKQRLNNDAIFNESVKQMFGRSPGITDEGVEQEAEQIRSALDTIATYEYDEEHRKKNPAYNYRYWTDFDLEQ